MEDVIAKNENKPLVFFIDYIALVVVSVSVISISLLIFNAFMPKVALFLGASLALLPFSFLKKDALPIANPQSVGLLTIGFLMLLAFRA